MRNNWRSGSAGLSWRMVTGLHPARVDVLGGDENGAWLRVVLREGKKRQIREVGKRIGLPVKRIIRIRIGTILLGDLKPGTWRNLTKGELTQLQKTVTLKPRK